VRGSKTWEATNQVSDCAQAKKLWRHIILHLIHPTLGNTACPSIVFGALDDFTSFENWFRCMHNARMMQLIMDGSLQTLKRLYDTADSNGEIQSEILNFFDLFRPLASDIIAEANHHETRCPSRILYPEKCDYVMVSALPNQFSALVDQFMLQEADHWRKQSALAMKAFLEAQKSPAGKVAKYDNCVQVNFEINFRLITANSYDNRGNSSVECCLCDPGVNFWEMRSFTGPVCVYHVLLPRAHFIKEHFHVIHDYDYVIQAPL